MPTVYYLNWDKEDANPLAEEFFHECHNAVPEQLIKTEFNDFYREVIQADTQNLGQLYHEWNYGFGYESQDFVKAEVLSMSVGDVVQRDEKHYICAVIGWDHLEIIEE